MPVWVANFFAPPAGQALCDALGATRSVSDCDHSTVWYNPPAAVLDGMRGSYGQPVNMRALAHISDDHGAAALLELMDGPDSALSHNDWPHVTLATEGRKPYTPVYSNCLVERAIAASGTVVQRDADGKPASLELPGGMPRWAGELPEGRCSGSATVYPKSQATLELLHGSAQGPYASTFCSNEKWDREAGVCQLQVRGGTAPGETALVEALGDDFNATTATSSIDKPLDSYAPDGSQVRLLSNAKGGRMAHFLLPASRVSSPVHHQTVEEIWYITGGRGEMWRGQPRSKGGGSRIDFLEAGVSLTIPVGVGFQFRSVWPDTPLEVVAVTMPPWPGPSEAVLLNGSAAHAEWQWPWQPSGWVSLVRPKAEEHRASPVAAVVAAA